MPDLVNKTVGDFAVVELPRKRDEPARFEVRLGDRLIATRDSEERATRVAEAAGQGPIAPLA